ncbi:UvrD-helicase domain-containing protein [Meiothermus ruber]|uniref:UvrD-helicase domain-containing protein n=1 Tax=Meiothermus ruber TaxID=277 RepID=UPI00034C4962|nr:UvrD-helicase domain-containing protein [Meiothermus ruber]GAO74953.1 exodeoxyribonuclease V [Meiothermus ruber H328]
MSLNPEQRAAVEHDGPVAVEAGAGTGKTHLMAHRYLWLVEHKGFSPLEIVAVTFTEKAARELRARVRRVLQGQVAPERVYEVEAAPIGTLHSLAARICQEYPEEAGVHPAFRILDEVESALWLSEHLDEALEEGVPPELQQLLPYSLLEEALLTLLRQPLEAEQAFRTLEQRLAGGQEALERAFHQGRARWAHQVRSLAEEMDGELRKMKSHHHPSQLVNLYHAVSMLLEAAAAAENDPQMARKHLEEIRFLKLPRAPEAREFLRDLKDKARRAALFLPEMGSGDLFLLKHRHLLAEAFQGVRNFLQRRKREDGVLNFADLEVHALRALDHPPVLETYRARWRAFLVDEHQDTNPIQGEILERLFGEAPVAVVGDRKQAIYGFRYADHRVFTGFVEEVKTRPRGRAVRLEANYRTQAPLLEAVDRLAEGFLGPLHQPLQPTRPAWNSPEPCLWRLVFSGSLPSKDKERLREAEARRVAQEVRTLLEKGLPDGPLRPGEIAILARTWNTLEPFTRALEAEGIPAVSAGGGSLLETPEARDGMALLAFLADPRDDLALLTLLRSPYFAVPDAVLHRLAEGRQAASWWEALQADGPEEPRQMLEELRQKRSLLPSFLLQEADLATGYTAVLAHLPGPERRLADYGAFLELVRGLEARGEGLWGVVDRLRTLARRRLELPRPPLGGLEAVQLLSVHAAKGLEWRVVFLVGLDRRPAAPSPSLLLHPERGLGIRLDKEPGGLYAELLKESLRGQVEEEARLLYVALTRARDLLVLSPGFGARHFWMTTAEEEFPRPPSFGELLGGCWERVWDLAQVKEREASPNDYPEKPVALPSSIS